MRKEFNDTTPIVDPDFPDKMTTRGTIFRRAIMYAVDQELIKSTIFLDHAKVPAGVVADNNFGFPNDLEPYPYNSTYARYLLEDILGYDFSTQIPVFELLLVFSGISAMVVASYYVVRSNRKKNSAKRNHKKNN